MIQSLRQDNQRLQGETSAQAVTIAVLNSENSQDRTKIGELTAGAAQHKADHDRLDRELKSELAKKVSVHRYKGEATSGGWPRKRKQLALFVVLHGKEVIAVEGDVTYLEYFHIPKGLKTLIVTFLCAIGCLPPDGFIPLT